MDGTYGVMSFLSVFSKNVTVDDFCCLNANLCKDDKLSLCCLVIMSAFKYLMLYPHYLGKN